MKNKIKFLIIFAVILLFALIVYGAKKNWTSDIFYSNDTYDFRLSFSESFVSVPAFKDGYRLCQVVTKTEDGRNLLKSEKIKFKDSEKTKINFYEKGPPYSEAAFSGVIGYKLRSFCRPRSVVDVVVFEKEGSDTLDSFFGNQFENLKTSFVDSAAGGGVIEIKVNVQGGVVPVISLRGSSVMENTTDQYYFDGIGYFYMLRHSYPKALIDQNKITDDFSRDTIETYNLALKIIEGFHVGALEK